MALPALKEAPVEIPEEKRAPLHLHPVRRTPAQEDDYPAWLNDTDRHSVLTEAFAPPPKTLGYQLTSIGLHVLTWGLLALGTAVIVYGVTLGGTPQGEAIREVIQTQGALTDVAATYVAGVQIRRTTQSK